MSAYESPVELAGEVWLSTFTSELDRGLTFFDFLAAYESRSRFVVVARVLDPRTSISALYCTTVGTDQSPPSVPSLTTIYPGATWHEREATEMFGLRFSGLDDDRPLLRHQEAGEPPLRKSSVLAARAVITWPGAAEPDPVDGRRRDNPSRRRMSPLGSPPPNWGSSDG